MKERPHMIRPIQLELPFTKTSYKNNFNNAFSVDMLKKRILNEVDMEFQDWFDPFVPSANWDKRPYKKFIVDLWVSRYQPEILEIYAVSENVARSYMEKNFLLNDLYTVADFPTLQLNNEIYFTHYYYKNQQEKTNDI